MSLTRRWCARLAPAPTLKREYPAKAIQPRALVRQPAGHVRPSAAAHGLLAAQARKPAAPGREVRRRRVPGAKAPRGAKAAQGAKATRRRRRRALHTKTKRQQKRELRAEAMRRRRRVHL